MFGRRAWLVGCAATLSLAVLPIGSLGSSAATAYEPPTGTVEYAIHHSKYDRIGTHSVSFSQNGDELIVTTVIHIKVKLLFITAHSLESKRREVWRGGRLVSYRADTEENGEAFTVKADMDNDGLVVEGPNGTVRADGPVFPTHPWNPEIVNQTLLMETKTGELLNVLTRADGEEVIEVAGRPVPTRRYVMSGDLERELWYDEHGNWVRLRFKRDGATVTFTRNTPFR